jgi:hypothetical protein
VAPEKRQGPLWDAYRALSQAGWAVDGRDYSTAFRVKPTPGRGFDELQVPSTPAACSDAHMRRLQGATSGTSRQTSWVRQQLQDVSMLPVCHLLQATLSETTPYLQCSWNLGMADVFPATSGKAAAAQFLMHRLGAQPAHCRLLVRNSCTAAVDTVIPSRDRSDPCRIDQVV